MHGCILHETGQGQNTSIKKYQDGDYARLSISLLYPGNHCVTFFNIWELGLFLTNKVCIVRILPVGHEMNSML